MQLSREEEDSIGEEKEVRREDQEKINRFSRLHSREQTLEGELKAKVVCRPISSGAVRVSTLADLIDRKKRKI